MYPPIFAVVSNNEACKALLGTSPTRLWPFGMAPQGVTLPYVVWQTITGRPENYINQVPDCDKFSIQIDAYGLTESSVRAVAQALRDAIEPVAHITSWRGESTDPDTLHKRFSFDVDWYVKR